MPTYDYVCSDCAHLVEVIHPIYGSGPTACALCGGKMRKALSTPAIVFKGSGWAKKDARAASRAAGSSGDKRASDGAKEGTAKEGTAKEGTAKEGTAKEGTSPASAEQPKPSGGAASGSD
jgi:putative FmdB family regulatory protein